MISSVMQNGKMAAASDRGQQPCPASRTVRQPSEFLAKAGRHLLGELQRAAFRMRPTFT